MRIACLFLLLLVLTLPVAANEIEQAEPVDSSLSPNTSIVTDSVDQKTLLFDADGNQIYPMLEERKAELAAYSRFKNFWRFFEFAFGLFVLGLILFTGLSARLRTLVSKIKIRFFALWLFVILLLLIDYLFNLPLTIYRGFIVESDYGFMNQTFLEWFTESLIGLSIGLIFSIIPAFFLYRLIAKYKRWWLVFSLGSIPFIVLLIVIVPVVISPMFNDFVPVKDKQLESKILTLASEVGIEGADVFQVNGSKQSTKVNAYVTGLFGTKRIVLYDTLIDGFTEDEIMFVMGHEMGHYIEGHMWWGLSVVIMFIMFALWLTSRLIEKVIRRFSERFGFDNLSDYASLPLIMIFVSIISFTFQPITNGLSRYWEHRSDRFGMDVTRVDGSAAAAAFDKLSVLNLSDPDPHPLVEFWFYDHPALSKRIAFVKKYASER